jgi:hypothetical protein
MAQLSPRILQTDFAEEQTRHLPVTSAPKSVSLSPGKWSEGSSPRLPRQPEVTDDSYVSVILIIRCMLIDLQEPRFFRCEGTSSMAGSPFRISERLSCEHASTSTRWTSFASQVGSQWYHHLGSDVIRRQQQIIIV